MTSSVPRLGGEGKQDSRGKVSMQICGDRDRCMVRMGTKYSMLVEVRNSSHATKLLVQKIQICMCNRFTPHSLHFSKIT